MNNRRNGCNRCPFLFSVSFLWGGPGPQSGRVGAHLPRDPSRSAPLWERAFAYVCTYAHTQRNAVCSRHLYAEPTVCDWFRFLVYTKSVVPSVYNGTVCNHAPPGAELRAENEAMRAQNEEMRSELRYAEGREDALHEVIRRCRWN